MADEIANMAPALGADAQVTADNIRQKLEVASGERIKSQVDPNVTFPDTDYDAQARAITEHYQAEQSNREAYFRSELQAPPIDPNAQAGLNLMRDVVNFGFHDELAAIGVDIGRNHLNWSLDNARDFWHEHPIRAGVAMVAGYGSAYLSAAKRVGIMARGGDFAAEHLVERGLVDTVEHYNNLSQDAKQIIQGQAGNIADIASLRGKIKDGTATPVDKAKQAFRTAFGNAYLDTQAMEAAAPYSTLKSWQSRVEELTSGRGVNGMLDLADNVPKGEGTAILHALKDPSQMKGLSQEGKLFAMAYGEESRRIQKELVESGFLTQETADKVGDLWFSTMRKDSKLFEEGPTTAVHSIIKRRSIDPDVAGSLRVVNIPRTASPHLLERSLDSDGVTSLIKRQRASEALEGGKTEAALRLLKDDPEAAPALELIKNNRLDEAKSILGKDGFIESNPKDLVVKSMLQQKLLFENFKTLRDIATDPNLTKTFEEVEAMGSAAKAKYINLNRMDNAATLRRMIAKKLGKTEIPELGYVHESLFHALADATNKSTIGSGVGLLEIGTAMLKTMKTSANPFTHLQNVLGNAIFMHMAGYNAFDREGIGLLKTSWSAVNDWKTARKSGAAIAEIRDLGKLKSKVKGGQDIDIASELMNPLLSGEHGILDMSSIEASEGIPMLAKLARQAQDEQSMAKGMIALIQKGSAKIGLDKASDLYMAEDSAMKFQYYLHHRMNGLNPLAAANEVARRLPMYGTVGSAIQRGRKVLYPWASFPTEATRIIKNNMMDRPFRTGMWLHAPNLIQTPIAIASGMSYEEVEKRKQQNPFWAQRMTSVVTGLRDKNDDVRTMILDMLPQSAIYPQTIAPDAPLAEKLPLNLGNPAPIIMGFIQAMMGKDSFGNDIPTDPNNPASKTFAALTSTIGLMMPPIIQKYLFNPSQTGTSLEPTLGKTGAALDTLAPNGFPGSRFRQDIGNMVNPSTGKTGDAIFDGILNNFLIKNYAGSANTEIGNERFAQREASNFRGRLGREFSAWAASGNAEQAASVLNDVYTSFLNETPDNPALAHQHYMDWLALHSRELMKNPSMRGLSKKDFLNMLSKAGDSSAPVVGQAFDEYKLALQQGYAMSGGSGGKFQNDNPLTRAGRGGRKARTGR